MPVPDNIMDVFKIPYYVKEMTIKFPNGDHSDILPEQIVGESLNLTESICSNSDFIFGVAEKNVFEINVVGLDNIKGKVIEPEVSCTIDDVTPPQTVTTKLGRFVVDECEIENYAGSAVQRKITAYSDYGIENNVYYDFMYRSGDDEHYNINLHGYNLAQFMYSNIVKWSVLNSPFTNLVPPMPTEHITVDGRRIKSIDISENVDTQNVVHAYIPLSIDDNNSIGYYLDICQDEDGAGWEYYTTDAWTDFIEVYRYELTNENKEEINSLMQLVNKYYNYSRGNTPEIEKIRQFLGFLYAPIPQVYPVTSSDDESKVGIMKHYTQGDCADIASNITKLPDMLNAWQGYNVLPFFNDDIKWYGSCVVNSIAIKVIKIQDNSGYTDPYTYGYLGEEIESIYVDASSVIEFYKLSKWKASQELDIPYESDPFLILGNESITDLPDMTIEQILPTGTCEIEYDSIGDTVASLLEISGYFLVSERDGLNELYKLDPSKDTKTYHETDYQNATHGEVNAVYNSIVYETENGKEVQNVQNFKGHGAAVQLTDSATTEETELSGNSMYGNVTISFTSGEKWSIYTSITGMYDDNISIEIIYPENEIVYKGKLYFKVYLDDNIPIILPEDLNYELTVFTIDNLQLPDGFKDYVNIEETEITLPAILGNTVNYSPYVEGRICAPSRDFPVAEGPHTVTVEVGTYGNIYEDINPNVTKYVTYDVTNNHILKDLGSLPDLPLMVNSLSNYNSFLNNITINIPSGGGDPMILVGTPFNLEIQNESIKGVIMRRTLSGLRAVSDSIECYGLEDNTSSSGYSSGGSQGGGGGGGYIPVPTPVDVNNSRITIEQGNFSDSFTLNQATDKTITLPDPGTANDGALTIKQGGTTLGTFTANQSTDTDINIPEPNNSTITIKQGSFSDTFTLDQATDKTITLAEADTSLCYKTDDPSLSLVYDQFNVPMLTHWGDRGKATFTNIKSFLKSYFDTLYSKVTANPGGASQDLTSIDINGTKYNISGGGGGGGTSTLESLWTNSSPSASFTAKTVSLDLQNYDFLIIGIRFTTTTDNYANVIVKTDGTSVIEAFLASSNRYRRSISANSSGITFGGGEKASPSATSYSSDNTCYIPIYVYGFHKITGTNNFIDLVATIVNGTTATITDSTISTATDFQFFTNAPGQAPTGVNVSGNTMTISFNNTTATQVKVRCWL